MVVTVKFPKVISYQSQPLSMHLGCQAAVVPQGAARLHSVILGLEYVLYRAMHMQSTIYNSITVTAQLKSWWCRTTWLQRSDRVHQIIHKYRTLLWFKFLLLAAKMPRKTKHATQAKTYSDVNSLFNLKFAFYILFLLVKHVGCAASKAAFELYMSLLVDTGFCTICWRKYARRDYLLQHANESSQHGCSEHTGLYGQLTTVVCKWCNLVCVNRAEKTKHQLRCGMLPYPWCMTGS